MSNYEEELEDMKHMSRQEYVASLRRHVFSKIYSFMEAKIQIANGLTKNIRCVTGKVADFLVVRRCTEVLLGTKD